MSKLVVTGGNRLQGRVRAGGRKNSAVAILPATLLADGPSTIENIPDIQDLAVYCEILRAIGVKVEISQGNGGEPPTAFIDPSGLRPEAPPAGPSCSCWTEWG